ncbi:protein NO VEIN domain-containing protein [Streptomyces lavendulocolor]|uniref:protein NO VEIN domain-containing protein n=1 Tax=Streptomyces lavendulocolor TaxID=67316 RepID=UPI003C2F8CFA
MPTTLRWLPQGRSGQDSRLTSAERQAIERRSVSVASAFFSAQGWKVQNVGTREPFDLLLKRGNERLHVEVKGTTSAGHDAILTRAEVEKQRKYYPANALVVVHSIHLDRAGDAPVATGGTLHCTSPWKIADEELSVISYAYRTALGRDEGAEVQSSLEVLKKGPRLASPALQSSAVAQ